MPEYSAKLNLEKPLGTENVNRGFFTRLIDDIDSKAGAPNGLARLDQDGNVLKADGSLAGEVTAAQFTEHKEERATVQKAGHVQLSDAISSTDTTKAATSNAVKKAYDRANEAFLSASNGKNMLTNAITGTDPRVVIPSDPSFGQLATAVRLIRTAPVYAKGSGNGVTLGQTDINIPLGFKPLAISVKGFIQGNLSMATLKENGTVEKATYTGGPTGTMGYVNNANLGENNISFSVYNNGNNYYASYEWEAVGVKL